MERVSAGGLLLGLCAIVALGAAPARAFTTAGVLDSTRGSLAVIEPVPVLDVAPDFERVPVEGANRWRSPMLRALLEEMASESAPGVVLPLRFQPASEPGLRPTFTYADPVGPAARMLVPPDPFDTTTRMKVVRPPRDADFAEVADGWTIHLNLRMPREGRRGVKLLLGTVLRIQGDPMAGRSAEGELDVTPWGTLSFAASPRSRSRPRLP